MEIGLFIQNVDHVQTYMLDVSQKRRKFDYFHQSSFSLAIEWLY